MWIKVHFQSGDEVAVNTQNICAVFPDQRTEYKVKGITCIQFAGEEENYIHVSESIDEIGAMIYE